MLGAGDALESLIEQTQNYPGESHRRKNNSA